MDLVPGLDVRAGRKLLLALALASRRGPEPTGGLAIPRCPSASACGSSHHIGHATKGRSGGLRPSASGGRKAVRSCRAVVVIVVAILSCRGVEGQALP